MQTPYRTQSSVVPFTLLAYTVFVVYVYSMRKSQFKEVYASQDKGIENVIDGDN